jgi:naringenin 3-dioxygenase
LSNGRFKNADHQAVVNGESSRLSIATFQNPAPDAKVWPLAVREGEDTILEEPITFTEMYRRKMARDLELAKRKKQAKADQLKQQLQQEAAPAAAPTKPLNQILA